MMLMTFCIAMFSMTSCSKHSSAFKESPDPDVNMRNVMTHAKVVNEFTLADMQEYTTETQRLIFNQLTPENRARLITDRLVAARDAETAPSKISTLNSLIALITPALYGDSVTDVQAAPIETIVEGMFTSFGYDETKAIVRGWGNSGTEELVYGGANPYCKCSSKIDYCSGFGKCTSGGCDGVDGCGTLFLYQCNGQCTLSGGAHGGNMTDMYVKSNQ